MTAKQIFDMLSDFAWAESLCLQTLLKLWVKNGRQNVILGLKMRGGEKQIEKRKMLKEWWNAFCGSTRWIRLTVFNTREIWSHFMTVAMSVEKQYDISYYLFHIFIYFRQQNYAKHQLIWSHFKREWWSA